MQFTLEKAGTAHIINDYGASCVTIQTRTYRNSLCISPHEILEDWQHPPPQAITIKEFATMCTWRPELLLLGTGERHVFVQPAIIAALHQQGIALEVMTTPAACRTYNVLVSERRKVAAALMLGD